MRKIEIGVVCIALCIGLALVLPQVGVSYPTVDDTVCLTCHDSTDLMALTTHSSSACTICHDGAGEKGNVNSSACIVCHPTSDPGKCALVNTAPHSTTCLTCHDSECADTTDTTTTAAADTTTTAAAVSTTTTAASVCSAQEIYGVNSAEVQVLRFVRDNILAATPEGQEIIRLYYQLSPIIVAAMQNDPAFRAEVKAMSDGVLQLVVQ